MRYNTLLINLMELLTKRYNMGKVLDNWRRCKESIPIIEPIKKELTTANKEALVALGVLKDKPRGGRNAAPHIPPDPSKVQVTAMVNDLQYITRFDYDYGAVGWVVRVGYGPACSAGNKNYWHRKFNDQNYNGCCWESLAAAMAYRDKCVAQAVVLPHWRKKKAKFKGE